MSRSTSQAIKIDLPQAGDEVIKLPWSRYRTLKRLKPLKAIRHKCLDCCNETPREVRLCPVKECALWPYRFGRGLPPEIKSEFPSVLQSIRLKCLSCAGSKAGIRSCWVKDCPLYPYRLGKNPARIRDCGDRRSDG